MFSKLNITQYTEKSFVVRGNTIENKEQLKNLGGKYNSNLKDGPGWIFPNQLKSNVDQYISSGKVTEPDFKSESKSSSTPSSYSSSKNYKDNKDKDSEELSNLRKRVESLEQEISKLYKIIESKFDNNKSTNPVKPKPVVNDSTDDEDEESEEIRPKSFLKKNVKNIKKPVCDEDDEDEESEEIRPKSFLKKNRK